MVIVTDEDWPIVKSGAHLKTTDKSLDVLKWLGVNMVTLANNHFMDYGESAAIRTQNLFRSKGIDYVGAGVNLGEARKWASINLKGEKSRHNQCMRTRVLGGWRESIRM